MGWLGTLASTMALGAVYNKIAAFLQQDALIFFLRPVTSPEKLAPIFIGLILLGTLMAASAALFPYAGSVGLGGMAVAARNLRFFSLLLVMALLLAAVPVSRYPGCRGSTAGSRGTAGNP